MIKVKFADGPLIGDEMEVEDKYVHTSFEDVKKPKNPRSRLIFICLPRPIPNQKEVVLRFLVYVKVKAGWTVTKDYERQWCPPVVNDVQQVLKPDRTNVPFPYLPQEVFDPSLCMDMPEAPPEPEPAPGAPPMWTDENHTQVTPEFAHWTWLQKMPADQNAAIGAIMVATKGAGGGKYLLKMWREWQPE